MRSYLKKQFDKKKEVPPISPFKQDSWKEMEDNFKKIKEKSPKKISEERAYEKQERQETCPAEKIGKASAEFFKEIFKKQNKEDCF